MAHPQAAITRRIGSWEILEVVGSGSFAIVWKARHSTTGTLAAVKEILSDRLNKKLYESLESEIAVLQRLKHANIVGLLDLYKEPGKIFLVLEYCAGGDLAQHLRQRGPLSEASCRYLLRHLAEGLKVLRQHNVIHRDLKPQNLLLSDNGSTPTLKIADFGFARSLQPAGLAETLCGSPLYMAPEVLQLHRYDAKADLWSVGTILFELLTGKPPFNGANHLQLIQNIERGDAVLPDHISRNLSPGCRQLLHQLLRRNPVERISFEELFAHPFLTGEAASAAVAAPPTAGLAVPFGGPAGSIAGGGGGGSGGTTATGAQDPQQPFQRRHTPTSHGTVRFVQPARVGSPVHPVFAAPTPSSAATAPQQPQQPSGGSQAPAAAAGPGSLPQHPAVGLPAPQPDTGAAATGLPPTCGVPAAGAGINININIAVKELTRSPSPRIIAAAAAVASAFQSDAPAPATSTAAAAPSAATTGGRASGPGAAAGSGGSAALVDSFDSDYVVVASPSAASRPPQMPLSPRTPHPAMACGSGSGRDSRNGSAGGALPPTAASAAPPPPAAAEAGAAAALAAATGSTVPASAAAAAGLPAPSWQQLLSPIAAATLPPNTSAPYPPPSGAALAAHRQASLASAAAAPSAAGGQAVGPAHGTATGTTVTIRVPPPGGLDGDSGDPLLVPRVVGLLLDHARSRCTALLDQEVEVRQLGESQAAVAAAAAAGGGASSFAVGGPGFGGGGAAAGAAAGAAGGGCGGAGLADEAAAAVGTLLVACRLLVAALSASTAGGGDGSRDGGSGGGDLTASTAAPVQGAKADTATTTGGAAAAATDTEACAHRQSGAGGGCDAQAATSDTARAATAVSSSSSPGRSLAALAALAVHARSLLAALDEHLHGTVAQLLMSGGDGSAAPPQRPGRPREGAAPGTPRADAAPPAIVPCGLDALLAAAVHHSRAAAGEELLGNAAGAADQYGRAADVLLFLLSAPPQHHPQQQQQQQPVACGQSALLESVRPPLTPHDRQRLTKYYAAVRLRQSAVLAALGPTVAAAGAAPPPPPQPPSAQHLLLQPHAQPGAHYVYPHSHLHGYSYPSQHHPCHGAQLAAQAAPPPSGEPFSALDQLYRGPHLQGRGAAPAGVTHGSAVAAAAPAAGPPGAGPYTYGLQPGYGAVVF